MTGTFVSVGNATQSFPRLLDAVVMLKSELLRPITIQYGNNNFDCATCNSVAFMDMESFISGMQESDLIIMHAGAGSVIHAVQAGKIPVLMPRRLKYGEHVDDHQLEFAHAMGEMGKVVVAEEPGDLPGAVQAALSLQKNTKPVVTEPRIVGLIKDLLQEYARELGK